MSKHTSALLILAIALAGCSTTPRSETSRFTGWVKVRSEVMLFRTLADYRDALNIRYRRGCTAGDGGNSCDVRLACVSGVFADGPRDFRSLNGQQVMLTGKLVDYQSLPNTDDVILPKKIYRGQVVMNYCLGDRVLLIRDMRPL